MTADALRRHRLVSLWELMKHFDLFDFEVLMVGIGHEIVSADLSEGGEHSVKVYSEAVETIQKANALAEKHFEGAKPTTFFADLQLKNYPQADRSTVAANLRHVRDALLNAAADYKFLRLEKDESAYFDNPDLFGESVRRAFPSAATDIRQAGTCLAIDAYTAAVFHMMRAVEWGMRALCADIGFRRFRVRSHSTKKISWRLVEYTEWEHILNQLAKKVEERLSRTRRGPKKQALQEFYVPVLNDLKGFKDAFRNHVMHTRAEYSAEDAEAILAYVKRFMVTLASRIKEDM